MFLCHPAVCLWVYAVCMHPSVMFLQYLSYGLMDFEQIPVTACILGHWWTDYILRFKCQDHSMIVKQIFKKYCCCGLFPRYVYIYVSALSWNFVHWTVISGAVFHGFTGSSYVWWRQIAFGCSAGSASTNAGLLAFLLSGCDFVILTVEMLCCSIHHVCWMGM